VLSNSGLRLAQMHASQLMAAFLLPRSVRKTCKQRLPVQPAMLAFVRDEASKITRCVGRRCRDQGLTFLRSSRNLNFHKHLQHTAQLVCKNKGQAVIRILNGAASVQIAYSLHVFPSNKRSSPPRVSRLPINRCCKHFLSLPSHVATILPRACASIGPAVPPTINDTATVRMVYALDFPNRKHIRLDQGLGFLNFCQGNRSKNKKTYQV